MATVFTRGADGVYHRRRNEPAPQKKVRGLPVMTFELAERLRSEYRHGGRACTQKKLAEKYGISRSTVAMITTGQIWNPQVHAG